MQTFNSQEIVEPKYFGVISAQILAIMLYLCTIGVFYIYYNIQVENRKDELLNDYYKIILNNSLLRLSPIFQKIPLDKVSNSAKIDKTDINNCIKNECIKSNIFEFASIIDKLVPNFINYKIEINKQLLHKNSNIGNYTKEKNYTVNKFNQISIGLDLDPKYLTAIKWRIAKPFLMYGTCLTLFLILFIRWIQLLNINSKNYYSTLYKEVYNTSLNVAKIDIEQKFNEEKNILLKKLWDLEFIEERDIELNQLFLIEANRLAITTQNLDLFNKNVLNKKLLPFSMVLYYQSKKQEEVKIKNLIELFTARFVKSEENISFDIMSNDQVVNFASKASLYQIIYSVISFIFFLLKEQSLTFKYNARLEINHDNNNLCLLFKFDGIPILAEEELYKYSSGFLKKYANPFLLSIGQIFSILREDNYGCTIGNSNINFIKIAANSLINTVNHKKNNIIKFKKGNE